MGTWNTYIAPLMADGTHEEYKNITSYTIGNDVGSIRQETEKNDFDIGIAPLGNVSLKLNNSEGLFSDVGNLNSIFKERRKGSKVKISYLFGEAEPICGVAIVGLDVLGPEEDVFEGYLIDKNADQNIKDDNISFTVLSKESLFDEYETDITGITSGDTIAQAIIYILENAGLRGILGLDPANMITTLNLSTLLDINSDGDLSYLENTSVSEAINILLEMTANILYIDKNFDVFVTDRSPNAGGSQYTFYGQAADLGIENIQDIQNYRSGQNRMFNFWRWADTTLVAKSASSIANYGLQKHEDINLDTVTETTAKTNLLESYRDSFSLPKKELVLTTNVSIDVLVLKLFDQVSIDYPNVPIPAGSGNLPVWNTSSMIWQDESTFDASKPYFSWPDGLFNIEISPTDEWKIIGIEIDTRKDLIKYTLREV